MADLPWRDAILRVLDEEARELHYADIAQAIIDRSYRRSVGATPAATVAAVISTQLSDRVVRVKRGVYQLADGPADPSDPVLRVADRAMEPHADEVAEDAEEMGLINAFGMFWRRDEVSWTGPNTRLLGIQQTGSDPVDFAAQAGVYILYDGSRAIYVGRVTQPRFAARLWEHTRDRLTGRWDRFSWFGVRSVEASGALGVVPSGIGTNTLITTMEALLIEGLEPPQNRRQGDGFKAMEFIQAPDPEIELAKKRALLSEMGRGLLA